MSHTEIKEQLLNSGLLGTSANLIGISVVKNESDIVESFVRHNLSFLDALFVMDNGSSDNTAAILANLQKEGLAVVCMSDDNPGHFQSHRLERLGGIASRTLSPEYIFPLDADEFILAESKELFQAELQSLPPNAAGRVTWKTYVPTVDDDLSIDNPLLRITHRRVHDRDWYSKVIAPSALFRDRKVSLMEGNHGINSTQSEILHLNLAATRLAHFPIRSERQLITKVLCGWLGIQLNLQREAGGAFHWEEMYQQLKSSGSFSRAQMQELGCGYSDVSPHTLVRDPLAVSEHCLPRYGHMINVEPMRSFFTLLQKIMVHFSMEEACDRYRLSELRALDSAPRSVQQKKLKVLLEDLEKQILEPLTRDHRVVGYRTVEPG